MALIRKLAALALCGALTGCSLTHGTGSGGPSALPSARAGFGGAPSSPAVVSEVEEAIFHTPSRNIFCALTKSAVRCDILHKTWRPPPKPADCELDWGFGLFLERGKAGIICAGDSVIGATPQETLAYGRALRSGDVVCASESSGLTCKDQKTGGGFTLASARYSLF
jgi:hypothetical protein